MEEPSRSNSRRALAGGAVAALALAGGGFLLGRNTVPPAPAPTASAALIPEPIASPEPAAPVADPTLDRPALLAAVRAAADAFASGSAIPEDVLALDGRRFDLRLPFGCMGPAAEAAPIGWRYDAAAQALRVTATPERFGPAAWLGAAAGEVDLAEGFWIDRPWTGSEDCPGGQAAQSPPDRTLALVQFYSAGASRVGRRDGEAFETVAKTAPDALRLERGLRLHLTGRVATTPGGRAPIVCRAPTPVGGRPICVVAVALDRVAIENPATEATLATWAVSSAGEAES